MDNGWNQKNSWDEGCFGIFQNGLLIVAIVAMIFLSAAGVSSMGFWGIFVGPIIVLLVWIFLAGIFS